MSNDAEIDENENNVVLWGESKVPDAEVIVGNFLGDNPRIPQIGTRLAFRPEHLVELQRCKESIFYFAENYYTITVGGNEKQLIKLWDIQKEALEFFQNNNRVVLNSARQTSKTTLVVLFILWNLLFGDGLQKIGMLGNKFDLAKLNLEKLKEAYEFLPLFIKPLVDKWNERKLLFDNNNECKITSTSSTSFRGETLTSLIIDEAAFVNENGKLDLDKTILQSLLPTLDAMAFSKHGDNSFCILISTPYGMNNEFARIFHRAKEYEKTKNPKIATKFRAFEILWSDHPDRDQKWFEDKVIEMGSEEAFWVEFGGSFTMGDNIKRIIDQEVRNYMNKNTVRNPIYTQDKNMEYENTEDDSLKIWKFPEKNHIYVAGVDVAEGVGDCYSTIQIMDVTDLKNIEQVAEYRCNTISTNEFPLIILKMLNSYNRCWATIEANNAGREVISILSRVHGYKKLVRHHHNKESNERMKKNEEFGVISHNNSKNMACANLGHFLNREKALILHSKELVKELDSFIKKTSSNNNWTWGKQGGIDSFDDLADALIWALVILHQKLVEDYFILEDPKYNKFAKPNKLISEVYAEEDGRKVNSTLLINQDSLATPIYFPAVDPQLEDDINDVSWLLDI